MSGHDQNNPPNPASASGAASGTEAVLPCLKERKWMGREHAVCRVLWEHQASAYMPWLAVGYDHPHSFEFINTDRLAAMHTNERALEQQAIANLRTRPAAWESLSVDVKDGRRLHLLVCSNDFFAAERIVDTDFMKEAQRTLKANGLLVGIPRRGLLLATNGEQSEEMVRAFGAVVAGQFSRGETAVISPMLFGVKDGAIIGIVEAIAEAIVPDGEPNGVEEEDEDDENAPYVSGIVTRTDDGKEDVHLMAGGLDADRLASAIESAFLSVLKEHAPRKEFSGHIRLIVLGVTPVSARPTLNAVFEHLRGFCSELTKQQGTTFRVTLTYQAPDAQWDPTEPAAQAAPAGAPAIPSWVSGAPQERGPFTWWTELPGFARVLLGLVVGYLILGRILSEMVDSWN